MSGQMIKAYFGADHERLEALFHQYGQLKRNDHKTAKGYFKAFLTGLKRHIVWEEDVLFPEFERKSGMVGGGPTSVMREEHRRISRILDAIHDKLRNADQNTEQEEAALLEVLGAHNEKEEQVLYPTLDRMITEKEAAGLFLHMDQIAPERFEACCEN